MDSLRKLFKALNSSAKPWQLSTAVIMAMFAGFLPMGSLILFDLFFIVLIFNINFGLFLLGFVIFSGIGYLFDPLFESLGYMILTAQPLEGIFTQLYNSTWFIWSSFNYTLVAGSLAASILLSVPVFFLLNRVILLYRDQIGIRLNSWKWTAWMKIFNEEAKSSSLFRWWGLGVFGGLASVVAVFMLFLFDPLARLALEKSLSYTLQTQVDIEALETSLSDLSVKVKGLQIADKDKLTHNLLAFDEMAFDLGFGALMHKKAMIESLKVEAMRFDEVRKAPAEAYGSDASSSTDPQTVEKTAEATDSLPAFALPDVNELLSKETLASVEEAEKFKTQSAALKAKWEEKSRALKEAKELDEIQAEAKALEQKLKGADLAAITSAASDIRALQEKVKALKAKYAALQEEFESDQSQLSKQLKAMKTLPQKDYERLKAKYSPNAQGGANLLGTFVDEKVGDYLAQALKYYAIIKPYLSEGETQTQAAKPPRGQGRWIHYANLTGLPEFVMKKAELDVLLKQDRLSINVTDMSSNQKLYGKAMKVDVDAKGSSYRQIMAHLVDDRRQEKGMSRFDVSIRELSQDAYSLGAISMDKTLSDIAMKGEIQNGEIDAKADVLVKQAKLAFPSQKLLDDIIKKIDSFRLDISLKGAFEHPAIAVKSDLNQQLTRGLRSMLGEQSKAFEEKLKSGILAKAADTQSGLGDDLGDFDTLLAAKSKELSGVNTDFSAAKSNPLKGVLPF